MHLLRVDRKKKSVFHIWNLEVTSINSLSILATQAHWYRFWNFGLLNLTVTLNFRYKKCKDVLFGSIPIPSYSVLNLDISFGINCMVVLISSFVLSSHFVPLHLFNYRHNIGEKLIKVHRHYLSWIKCWFRMDILQNFADKYSLSILDCCIFV